MLNNATFAHKALDLLRRSRSSLGDGCSIRKSALWDSVGPFDVIPGIGVGPVEVL